MLAILYPYWSDHMLWELNGHGRMTFTPVARRMPYLAVTVDRSEPSSPYRGRAQVVRGLAGLCGEDAVARLEESGEAWGARRSGDAIRFLALADNHIMTVDAKDPTQVIDDAFWPVSEHRDTFFYPVVTLADTTPREPGGTRIVCLLDTVIAKGKQTAVLGPERHLLWPDRSLLGVRHALAMLQDQIDDIGADWIVFGHYRYDAKWRQRAAKFRLQPEDYANGFRDLVTAVQHRARIAVARPITSDILHSQERSQVQAFFSAIEPICAEFNVPILETPAEVDMQSERNRPSKAGLRAWFSTFDVVLGKLAGA